MSLRRCVLFLLAGLAACATDPELGGGSGNVASGSAAGSATAHANDQLQHCSETLGTMAVEEDEQAPWYAGLFQYHLPSTVPLLRLIIQQSGCFVLVDRGRALHTAMDERALAASGELREGSNMGKGQIVAADYTMSPSINFNQKGTSGFGTSALALIPVAGGLLSSVAASAHSNEASTTLLLVDNRSSVQIAAAQGSAKNWDFGGGGGFIGIFGGALAGGGLSGYSNTPEGKLLTAAFLDSYNQMVLSLRNYQAQNVRGGLGTGGLLKVQGSTN